MKRYLSAQEVAEILGVSKDTLYSYVSRGLVRSEESNRAKRERRYLAEDVQKLKEHREYRRNPAQVAKDALHWGTPLLDSALTLITENGLYYRGRDVLELARTSSFEQVAALLWTSEIGQAGALFAGRLNTAEVVRKIEPGLTAMQRVTLALTLADDLAGYDLRAEALAYTGARILGLMATALTMQPMGAGGIAEHLQQAWRPEDERAAKVINAALILCADHELNVSAFAARVTASAGATPYAVVTAGLAALSGFRHGGAGARVEAFFREIGTTERIRAVIADRLRWGEPMPGFGHTLYPDGDPRAKTLLALLEETYPDAADVGFTREVAAQVKALTGQAANVDFALVALARAAQLPPDAPLALFALGRTAGWIGHAIEQYASGALIRPRARYTGEMPK
ncbi:MAG: citrate synthase family protein [Chloroflexota bacterium]